MPSGPILVTGGAGAIGSNLVVEALRSSTSTVTVLDDFSGAAEWSLPDDSRLRVVRGSVRDPDARREALDPRPTVVFHLAAFFANQNSVEHPGDDLQTNGVGTLGLFEDCDRRGVERVVYASTSAIEEDSAAGTEPGKLGMCLKTPYQVTKALGELYGYYFHRERGLSFTAVRIFNSYGPGELPGRYRNVIPNFILRALQGHPLPVVGDGSSSRCYTYVRDVAEGFLAVADQPELAGCCVRLGSGVSTTALELANAINRLTGNQAGTVSMPMRSWETLHRLHRPDTSSLSGWRASTSLETGLLSTVAWFRAYWDLILASRGGGS